MLTLLLGPDDFSKKEYIASLAEKNTAEVEFFIDLENLPHLENLTGLDLFSKPKIFVLKNLVAHYNQEEAVAKFIASKNQIIILEEKLDKRSSDNKKLLANKDVVVKEFILPHGKELDTFIKNTVSKCGAKITPHALNLLAQKMGRDDYEEVKFGGKVVEIKEVFNLWGVDNEIKKLAALAGKGEITEEMVEQLVKQFKESGVLTIVNAIAEKNKTLALSLMGTFLQEESSADEKDKVIHLNAMLSEQFRNVAVVQDFLKRKLSDAKILDLTAWKTGRLFILKKIAPRFSSQAVMDLLNKLEALDAELKTSQTPPRVLLDLITTQLVS